MDWSRLAPANRPVTDALPAISQTSPDMDPNLKVYRAIDIVGYAFGVKFANS